jgi:SAM-dependent methyltransferase
MCVSSDSMSAFSRARNALAIIWRRTRKSLAARKRRRIASRPPAPNSSRVYLERWVAEAARQGQGKNFRVLDAGSGVGPYRDLFDDVTYESADFKPFPQLTYECDLASIPVEDGRFDLVLSTQTLEHLPDPLSVLREFERVVKPGGEVWLSAPLFFEEHGMPYDFYRFTRYGFEHLATEAGFVVREVAWLEGYYGTLAYQLRTAAGQLSVAFLPLRAVFSLLARMFTSLDLRHKVTDRGMCKNYRCVLVKPTSSRVGQEN